MVNHVNFIWNIAESLRGPFKPSEYGSVVLPFTVLRRLDAVLADTKTNVLDAAKGIQNLPEKLQEIKLTEASEHQFYNTSPFPPTSARTCRPISLNSRRTCGTSSSGSSSTRRSTSSRRRTSCSR